MYVRIFRIINKILNVIAPIVEEEVISLIEKTKRESVKFQFPDSVLQAVEDWREVERRCHASGCGCPNCAHQMLAEAMIVEAVKHELGLPATFFRYLPQYERDVEAERVKKQLERERKKGRQS